MGTDNYQPIWQTASDVPFFQDQGLVVHISCRTSTPQKALIEYAYYIKINIQRFNCRGANSQYIYQN